MSLLGRSRTLRVDEVVKKALASYGRAPAGERADVVRQLAMRMTPEQRRSFSDRLAEVALGHLWVLMRERQG